MSLFFLRVFHAFRVLRVFCASAVLGVLQELPSGTSQSGSQTAKQALFDLRFWSLPRAWAEGAGGTLVHSRGIAIALSLIIDRIPIFCKRKFPLAVTCGKNFGPFGLRVGGATADELAQPHEDHHHGRQLSR